MIVHITQLANSTQFDSKAKSIDAILSLYYYYSHSSYSGIPFFLITFYDLVG